MKEKTRQRLLASGLGLTRRTAAGLVAGCRFESWSGCMTGSDWSGSRAWVNGRPASPGLHRQNDAPTGWETRGQRAVVVTGVVIGRGDKLVIKRRFAFGRNGDGDAILKTTRREWVVV